MPGRSVMNRMLELRDRNDSSVNHLFARMVCVLILQYHNIRVTKRTQHNPNKSNLKNLSYFYAVLLYYYN